MVTHIFNKKNIFIVNTSDFTFIWRAQWLEHGVCIWKSKKGVSVTVYRGRIEDGGMFALVNSIRS